MNNQHSSRDSSAATLEVTDLKKHYPVQPGLLSRKLGMVHAVDGVTFSIRRGETLGLVGESGCGKSTTGKTILRLIEPTGGNIKLLGRDITQLGRAEVRRMRREMQMVFQDPYGSLNPRMTAGEIVMEPLAVHGIATGYEKEERAASLFARVGLREAQMADFPHQFSGGQRQRIGIARALAVNPGFIVCDEPVSALDVSIQAQVVNLLMDLQDEYKITYLFIAHDLAVVRHISHRIAVMYLGRIVELAPRNSIFAMPLHPYTQALLSAIPVPDPKARRRKPLSLAGDIPSPSNPPTGCHLHTRCPYAMEHCRQETPALREIEAGHWVACHLH